MKHMILSSKVKGGVISHHFLMLWFQKYSPYTVGFGTFRGGSPVKDLVLNYTNFFLVLSFNVYMSVMGGVTPCNFLICMLILKALLGHIVSYFADLSNWCLDQNTNGIN